MLDFLFGYPTYRESSSQEEDRYFHDRLMEMAKVEARKPSGPAMDHEPTAKYIRGEYWTRDEYEYATSRLNQPGTADANGVPIATE
jgi:hypothetical protein